MVNVELCSIIYIYVCRKKGREPPLNREGQTVKKALAKETVTPDKLVGTDNRTVFNDQMLNRMRERVGSLSRGEGVEQTT